MVMAAMLSGCGGGSGSGVVSAPPPLPTPTPPPAPPAGTNFDTAEYRRSNAAVAAEAISAYQAGATGAGVTVAVIDSGVASGNPEFAGRISPFSRDLVANRSIEDEDGHGTEVAGIILAARDDTGIQGVAFGATLLALRADRIGSCAETKGCSFGSTDIATGFDVAASARARVVNVSLGGGSAPLILRQAVARAAAAGAVTVLSAGNDGNPEVDAFASSLQGAAPGTVIVAGAIDADRNIASFSNRAGAAAPYFLTALGVRVRSFDQTGAYFFFSGTSESTPVISGAAALLTSAFPDLTPTQIVDILLRTADDIGEPGTDPIYGRGALNITRAFSPIGRLSVDKVADPLTSAPGSLGSALGDGGAFGAALAAVPARDSYGRAFAVDVSASLRRQPPGRLANALLGGDVRAAAGRFGSAEFALMARGNDGTAWRGDVATGADRRNLPRGQLLGGQARLDLAPGRTAVLGFGQSAGALLDAATNTPAGAATLVAWRASDSGVMAQPTGGGAVAQQVGSWTLGTAFGSLEIAAIRGGLPATATATGTLGIVRADRSLGAARFGVAIEVLTERGSLLGSQLPASFGVRGAVTTSAIISAAVPFARWTLRGEALVGRTVADLTGQGLVQGGGRLLATAGSLSLVREAVFAEDDRLSLTIAQPLRSSGQAELAFGSAPLRLGPSGREIAFEAGYAGVIAGGGFSLGSFWRHQPGNLAGSASDIGGAARLHLRF